MSRNFSLLHDYFCLAFLLCDSICFLLVFALRKFMILRCASYDFMLEIYFLLIFNLCRIFTYDCGVHLSMYLKHWKPRVKMQDFICDADILNLRNKLANEMPFSDQNILTEAKNHILEY